VFETGLPLKKGIPSDRDSLTIFSLDGLKMANIFRKLLNNHYLGGCPRIESLLLKSGLWPDFLLIFDKYNEYSPQIMRKSTSNPLSLVTSPILGQPPRQEQKNAPAQ